MSNDFIKKLDRIREQLRKLYHTADFDKLPDKEKIKILDANIKLKEVSKEISN